MMNKSDKIRILEAYFEKTISKEEMEFLLKHGKVIAPIEWVYTNEDEKKQRENERELISRVFGQSFPKIEWVVS
ncbi:hypothetical protein [Belliella pelovolcani]|uniref:hypothetical protein n=1 Tax=Belliella pelovolcani TaxID=529505 RepID=UPI00391A2227